MKTRSLAVLLSAFVLAGCALPPPKPKAPPASLEEIVSEHNASASRIQKLWASAKITAWIPSRPFPWTFTSGILLLGKGPNPTGPHDFVLLAREGGQPVFQLGSNVEQNVYYFWYHYGDQGKLWRGRLSLAGAPGVDMPIDPTQLPAVLNVLELPTDQTKLPAVDMRLCDPQPIKSGPFTTGYEPYSYVLNYVDRQALSGRTICKRQIFVVRADDKPRLPYKINFLSPDGRVVMSASLDKYKPIEGTENISSVARPAVLMPTEIEVVWPEQKSRLRMTLSDMSVDKGEPNIASQLVPPNVPQVDVDEFIVQPAVPASRPAQTKGSK